MSEFLKCSQCLLLTVSKICVVKFWLMINFRVIPPRPGGKIVPTRPQTEYIFALVGRLKLTALNDRVGKTQCTREEFLLKIELTYRMFRFNSQ